MPNKSYSELIKLETFKERFEYLKVGASVGSETFGSNRYLNQKFYSSYEWRRFRRDIIIRDLGCDLGVPGYQIQGKIYIHHINPITMADVEKRSYALFDPENAICVSFDTHQAIHFGDESLIASDPIKREPNDTCPWRCIDGR